MVEIDVNNSNEAVTFDVGGHTFKVGCSLLNLYQSSTLYRMMISKRETWSSMPNPIFIDRDGHRFAYVMEYMRDNGNVTLPITVSKESFLKELLYYGFDSIQSDLITTTSSSSSASSPLPNPDSVYEVVKHLQALESKYTDKMKKLEFEKDCLLLAHECYCQYFATTQLRIQFNPKGTVGTGQTEPILGRCFDGKIAYGFENASATQTTPEILPAPAPLQTSKNNKKSGSRNHNWYWGDNYDIRQRGNLFSDSIQEIEVAPLEIPTPPTPKDIYPIAEAMVSHYEASTSSDSDTNITLQTFTSTALQTFNMNLKDYGLQLKSAEIDSNNCAVINLAGFPCDN